MKRATRASFGNAITELGASFPQLVVLDADLSKSTMTGAYAKAFPTRYFEMGIQEANMIGVAAGLALSGKVPFMCSFACFLTGRFDTIRVSVGYSGANVRMVGTHSGIGIGEDGYSQMGLEDIACMRTLPGVSVLQPADDIETTQMIRYLMDHQGPVYLRLTRQEVDSVHDAAYKFQFGKMDELKSGKQSVIFATGGLTANALKAAHALQKDNLDVAVVNVHTIKPLDEGTIASWAKKVPTIFTAEDHNIIGGLGGAVAEVLAGLGTSCRLVRIGVHDTYGESGTPEALYTKHGLDETGVARTVKAHLNTQW